MYRKLSVPVRSVEKAINLQKIFHILTYIHIPFQVKMLTLDVLSLSLHEVYILIQSDEVRLVLRLQLLVIFL